MKKEDILSQIDIVNYYKNHTNEKIIKGNDEWYNTRCPFPDHKDNAPSFGYNTSTGAFKCFGCNRSGDLFKFEAEINNTTYKEAIKNIAHKYNIKQSSHLEVKVERYHRYLMENKDNSLTAIREMGITENTALKLKLGYMPTYGKYEARLIFPIYDKHKNVFTIKKYSRTAPSKYKSKFEKGGKVSLYGIDELLASSEKTVVICAGEKDKAVAQSCTDKYLFVTFTGGENTLPQGQQLEETLAVLKGRNIIIAYDCDSAGIKGAKKLQDKLSPIANAVIVLQWNESFSNEFPKGDITDFLTKWKHGGKQVFIKLLQDTEKFLFPRQSGNIREEEFCYTKNTKGKSVSISNFIIIPTQRVWIEDKEAVKAILKTPRKNHNMLILKEAWNCRYNFLKEINSIDILYTGNDNDLLNIQNIVSSYETTPITQGTKNIGYTDGIFVFPEFTIPEDRSSEIIFIKEKGEHPFTSIFNPKFNGDISFLPELLKNIFKLHEEAPLLIFLGWIFATPFKTKIIKLKGHFPILNVYGTRGSGKTSLTILLWRLFGFTSGEIFSCTQTPFAWLKFLSSTNTLPLFFDEFKPWDMSLSNVQNINRLIRRIYTGEIESRGRQNQTLTNYKLQAPIGILGEVSFREAALLERILPVPLSFQKIKDEQQKAYTVISRLPLENFLYHYLQWAISIEAISIWESIEEQKSLLKDIPSNRIKDNISTVFFGLNCLTLFSKSYGYYLPEFDLKNIVDLCIRETCEEVDGGKLAIDILLEKLSYMAESRILVEQRDYKTKNDNVYIRLEPCIDKFRKWAKEVSFEGEILNVKAYRQMLRERKEKYVIELGKKVRMGAGTYQCVCINKEKAKKLGMDVEGFYNH